MFSRIKTYKICPEPEAEVTTDAVVSTPEESAVESLRPMFGTALNNVGYLYSDYTANEDWNDFIETVGFTQGAYTVGAESHWIHWISKKGGYSLIPTNLPLTTVTPPVGMRANTNEIYSYTGTTSGAVNLQTKYNDTLIDFFEVTKSYTLAHNQVFIFTANITHGSLVEMEEYLANLVDSQVTFKLRYDNEVSVGSAPMTSANYILALEEYENFMASNYPNINRVINAADHNTTKWSNIAVAAFANSKGIEEFCQYFWLGDLAGNRPVANNTLDIDAYFTVALSNTRDSTASGNKSLYGEVLPRLQVYYDTFYPCKMQVGQYGCSLQRTGYVANTMLHGLMIWNELFEFFKFNYTHNNFISSAIFLENESAVDIKTSQDSLFTIDSSLEVVSGSDTFVKRIQGVAYELLKPLSTSLTYPTYIPVTFTNQPNKLDAVAFTIDSIVYIFIYNILTSTTIVSIERNAVVVGTDIDKTGAYSTELYGSVGSSPAYNYFKDYPTYSPSLVPTDVVLISDLASSSSNIAIPEHSIVKIKLIGVTSATSIVLNF